MRTPSFLAVTAWAAGAIALLFFVGGIASGVVLDAVTRDIEQSCARCTLVVTSPADSMVARLAMVAMLVGPILFVWLTLGVLRLASGQVPSWRRIGAASAISALVSLLLLAKWIFVVTGMMAHDIPGAVAPMIAVRSVGPDGSRIVLALVFAVLATVALSREKRRTP